MPGLVRRAGRGRVGENVATWTVAEGRRGRRWREVVVGPDGGIRHSLLLETSPNGRFSHLELATPAGLLTLHPEGDGTLHGNAVRADGVGHVIGLPWSDDAVVLLEGSPVCDAAAAATAGTRATVSGVAIHQDLHLEPVSGITTPVAQADDLPALDGATAWELEV